MSACSQMKTANKLRIQNRQRNVTRPVVRKLNNACTHPPCRSSSAEKCPAVEEKKKVSYLEIRSYRSNASRGSTCRPSVLHVQQPAVVMSYQRAGNLFPQSLLNSPWVSRSACQTARAVQQAREATRRPSRAPGSPTRPCRPSSCCRRDLGRNARLQVW